MTATDSINKVCVIGGGAIGSLVAAHLGQVVDVSVLVRRSDHAEAINENGLTLVGKSDLTIQLSASTDPELIDTPDLWVIATKLTQLSAAVAQISNMAPEATVLTMQNGIGAEPIVSAMGPWKILSGVTFMSGRKLNDYMVEYELDTATWMGPYQPTGTPESEAHRVADLFQTAGLQAKAFSDLRPAQWSKLLFNAAVNCVAALTDLPHVALFARQDLPTDLGHVVRDLISEGTTVAEACGVELFEDPWEMNCQAVQTGNTAGDDYAHVPSMLEDVRSGHPTEVDYILGAVVREADARDMEVPVCRAVYRLVKARDRSHDSTPDLPAIDTTQRMPRGGSKT
jgi:2-dehydropantoate 2-reductase